MNWTVPFLNSLTACLGSVCAERIPDSQGGASSALHSKLLYTRNCCPGTFDSGSIKTSAHSEIWWPRPSTSVMNIGKLFWIIPDTGDSGPKKTWDAMIQSAILASFSINAMVLCKQYAHITYRIKCWTFVFLKRQLNLMLACYVDATEQKWHKNSDLWVYRFWSINWF